MIQMLPEYQQIFLLRLQGKTEKEIRKVLGLSVEGYRDLSSREDFLKLQRILSGEIIGEFEYSPSMEARRACQELDVIDSLKTMIQDESGHTQENVKLQAIKCLIEIGNWDREGIEQNRELDREIMGMNEEFLKDITPSA